MGNSVKIITESKFFNVLDTLECGQIFRFAPFKKGFMVISADKCAYVYNEGDKAIIECDEADEKYFYNYFDLDRDYSLIYEGARSFGVDVLSLSADLGKGIRILNQDRIETLFSFIISQNNNIKRIKGIIERLSESLGEKKNFLGHMFFAFPTAERLAEKSVEFYKSIGLGYRAEYIKRLAIDIKNGLDLDSFNALNTKDLNKKLISIYGVGPKVANCVTLFGFHRSDSFPVDTWIEKVYREDFKGQIKNRDRITEHFLEIFKENAGYYQQYLFYYKRSKEKTLEKGEKDN